MTRILEWPSNGTTLWSINALVQMNELFWLLSEAELRKKKEPENDYKANSFTTNESYLAINIFLKDERRYIHWFTMNPNSNSNFSIRIFMWFFGAHTCTINDRNKRSLLSYARIQFIYFFFFYLYAMRFLSPDTLYSFSSISTMSIFFSCE